ncbi:MAG: glycosyltransferase family 2 protein [Hyphomonadaceae bacterium]|nr:glycosyltransferase family 2 protein [Hyphomonadaceae bacterium]
MLPPPESSSRDTRTTVLVAAFNAAATLERAVLSALAQPETAEVCIVDDASTDATAAVARGLAERDQRVKFIAFTTNAGPGAARNAAIEATSAPWLTVLDADDFFLEGRLASLHAIAGDADFVADDLIRTRDPSQVQWTPRQLTLKPLTFRGFVLRNLGKTTGPLDLGYMKPLARRAFLDAHKLRYQADMRLGEDYELYARALALGARFFTCGEAGYVSVERAGSLSKEHGPTELKRLYDCDDLIEATGALSPADRRALDRHRASVDCRLQWRLLIEAAKSGDSRAALATFRTPRVSSYLVGKLLEQAWLRSTGRGPRRRAVTPATLSAKNSL